MKRHGCACGAQFARQGELIAHGLAVFPAKAARPLDDRFHAPRWDGSDPAYWRAAEWRRRVTSQDDGQARSSGAAAGDTPVAGEVPAASPDGRPGERRAGVPSGASDAHAGQRRRCL